jgi:hypothetical protein
MQASLVSVPSQHDTSIYEAYGPHDRKFQQ